jgi:hypothetical protein
LKRSARAVNRDSVARDLHRDLGIVEGSSFSS